MSVLRVILLINKEIRLGSMEIGFLLRVKKTKIWYIPVYRKGFERKIFTD